MGVVVVIAIIIIIAIVLISRNAGSGNESGGSLKKDIKKLRADIDRYESNIANFSGACKEENPQAAFLYDAALREIGPARDRLATLEKELAANGG